MRNRFYHKGIIIILCIILVLPNLIHSSTVSASGKGTVTADTLNVRTKPSTSAARLQLQDGTYVYLRKDETVALLDKDGDWYYVSLQFNGKSLKGYVHGDYIRVDKPIATPTTEADGYTYAQATPSLKVAE